MAIRVRLWNPEWKSAAITEAEVIKPDVHGKCKPYIEMFYSGASSAAAAELGAAANNVLDGTTTPVRVYADSNSADDTDSATKDVRKVRIIGVSVKSSAAYIAGTETPVYSLEEVNMNGTTAVQTVRYYLRLIHFYAADWGSGGSDAKGTITVQDDAAGTTKYLTIAAAANESNGSVIYGAEEHYGRWSYCRLGPADAAFNNT